MYQKNYFNFKKIGNQYLLTNEMGNYAFVSYSTFQSLIQNKPLSMSTKHELQTKQFIYTEEKEDFAKFHFEKLQAYKAYLEYGTVLHIFVISKNCNFNCVYCQAGNLNQNSKMVMDENTAQKAVDIAFESSSKELTFEFQGGEPLINFDVLKYIVLYSKSKNDQIQDITKKKCIQYTLVSNLSLLTDEMISFVQDNQISVCTSIDGNASLQNINRPFLTHDSYESTIQQLKKLQSVNVNISAILTTTKFSLSEYKSIVDEYINLGLNRIFIRPLTRLGKADANWEKIGYTPEEFLKFYQKALQYIIQQNKKGVFLAEGIARTLLIKILKGESENYMELRSPCGGTIGQLAYYYDGNIYTCDEGRMLAEMGDNEFLLGNVLNHHYVDLIRNECTKKVCMTSCLETSKCCHSCVYMPYCGTCPVVNYAKTGNMELASKNDFKCKIMTGILDTLFTYIKKDANAVKIFNTWI